MIKKSVLVFVLMICLITGRFSVPYVEAAYVGIDKDFEALKISGPGEFADFTNYGISLNNNTSGKYARIVYDPDADPGEENKVLLLTTEVGQSGSVFIQIFAPRPNNVTQLKGIVVANYDIRRSAGGSSASFEAAALTVDSGDNATGINVQFEKDGYIKRSGVIMKDLSNADFEYAFDTWYNVKMVFDINTGKVITVVTRKDDGSAQTHIMDMPDAFKLAFDVRGLARFRATVGVGSDYNINAYYDNFKAYTLNPLQIDNSTPENGAPRVSTTNRALSLAFNNPMLASSVVQSGNIGIVKATDNTPVGCSVHAVSDKEYTIMLDEDMDFNTEYNINLSENVKDIAEQTLESDKRTITFYTENELLAEDAVIDNIQFKEVSGQSQVNISNSGLVAGKIKGEIDISNVSPSSKTITAVAVLYMKDIYDVENFVKFSSMHGVIASGETKCLDTELDVPAHSPGEYYIRIFVWDTLQNYQPLTDGIEFDNTGIHMQGE